MTTKPLSEVQKEDFCNEQCEAEEMNGKVESEDARQKQEL